MTLIGRGDVVDRDDLVGQVSELLCADSAVVTLVGEPGIGKTTAWYTILEDQHAAWRWVARCLETEADLGLAVLADLFAALPTEITRALPPPQQEALDLVLYRVDRAGHRRINDRLLGATTLGALRALAERGPVIIGIDDVQWCDPTSLAALTFALHRLVSSPVSLLATRRSGTARDFPQAHQVAVDPLPHDRLVSWIRSTLAPQATETQVAEIADLSAGNPFFAKELATGLALTARARPLPESLRAALHRRIDALDRRSRRVLIDVAVRGAPRRDEFGIGELDSACAADVLRVDGDRVRFSHPLLLEATIDAAPAADVRSAHATAAMATSDPVVAVLHRAQASGPDAALAAELDAAVDVALRCGDLHGAQQLAALALAKTPSSDGRPIHRVVILAERLAELNGLHAAGEYAAEAVEDRGDPAWTARALLVAAEASSGSEAAYARLDEIIQLPDCPREFRLTAVSGRALGHVKDGRLAEGIRLFEAALCEMKADSPGWTHLVGMHALASRVLGMPVDQDRLDAAVAHERNSGLPTTQQDRPGRATAGTALAAAAILAVYDDRHGEAERLLQEAERYSAERGYTTIARNYPPLLALRTGRLREAEAGLQWLLDERSDRRNAVVHARLAVIRALRGDGDGAKGCLRVAESYWADSRDRSELLFARGAVEWFSGNSRDARPALDEAARLLAASGYREPSNPAVLVLAVEVSLADGDQQNAEALTDRLESDSRLLASRYGLAAVSRCRGQIAEGSGQVLPAQQCYEASARAFTDLGVRLEGARSYFMLGSLLRRSGQRRRAREALETARAIFGDCEALVLLAGASDEIARIGGRSSDLATHLTESERQVAEHVATGMRNIDVARAMNLSVKTVETHLGRLYRKLGVSNRTELARLMMHDR